VLWRRSKVGLGLSGDERSAVDLFMIGALGTL
jgi:hypothetical protein